ncbi:MAG: acetyl-CoA C-acyltransferase [Gemmatimonadetes bacterium]|uniref:Acetyl-CoA C-acyltransferase n=1 Tax=Candidatus Kutchimonas denitrificans TaxID=3056748 RepID=A0AAE4Z5J2_9BACT|nr:acetyl-CoA C-acyltransferase [Gemmatimonadota bacterium]NIR74195.1 acetyl-CoA C-acyltransferase [Candidatus Kutchimonas denitrificans]NIR99817.1 acetyl-CoA C-acyltransferase [Gemmatimonadota bacterium]NIT65406.1 acetyl-CoA C-acyltransferase [Gemmatimonadota bacterium]NIU51772.1 acetyl-CoA C-acyltransferase [Gemmatimonadota bacterium]
MNTTADGARNVYVCAGPRTAFAKIDGPLAQLDAVGLGVPVVQEATKALARGSPDLVVWGAVIPSLSVSHLAREIWLDARLDPYVPALTVVQQCATSLAAATHAAAQMKAGRIDLALCGGSESMSNVQTGLTRGMSRVLRRVAQAKGPGQALQALGGLRLRHVKLSIPGVKERTTGLTMGEHAEITTKEWNIDRESQDRFALGSHRNAIAAWEGGFFDDLVMTSDAFPQIERDGIPRADTSLEKLANLPPVFDRKSGQGTLTAGNSSPLTDGAAACWVATERGLGRLGQALYRARLLDWEVAAVDIERDGLLMAPSLAVPRLLARQGLRYSDIGLWEVHEAFAAQVLFTIAALNDRGWLKERAGVDADLGTVPEDRINPVGGSVALGHPFGATGARILSQAVKRLSETGGRALVSICAAGGMGHVALLEAV